MSVLWLALLGVATGVVARLVAPGRRGPLGFFLTATLGVAARLRRRHWARREGGTPEVIQSASWWGFLGPSSRLWSGRSGSRAVAPPPQSEEVVARRCGRALRSRGCRFKRSFKWHSPL